MNRTHIRFTNIKTVTSEFHKCNRVFIDQLNSYQLLKEDCTMELMSFNLMSYF
jgi:hypothetical protein